MADLRIGETLQGRDGPLRVEGALVFKEWDQEDKCFYRWEEWRLSGRADDTWVELDHYDGAVYLYTPLPITEPIDPQFLAAGQILTLTSGGTVYAARVTEVGAGELVSTGGRPDYRLSIGERMGYAELELTDAAGATTLITMDTHGLRDLVSYTKTALDEAAQTRLFGRPIHRPARRYQSSSSAGSDSSSGSSVLKALMWLLVCMMLIPVVISCDSQDEEGTGSPGGSYRPLHGGGGGGVGK